MSTDFYFVLYEVVEVDGVRDFRVRYVGTFLALLTLVTLLDLKFWFICDSSEYCYARSAYYEC